MLSKCPVISPGPGGSGTLVDGEASRNCFPAFRFLPERDLQTIRSHVLRAGHGFHALYQEFPPPQ